MSEHEPTTATLSRGRPPHASSAARRDSILALHGEGLSGVAIARRIGVTPAAVCYHLKKARAEEMATETPVSAEAHSG